MLGLTLYVSLAFVLGILTTPNQGVATLNTGVAISPGPSVLVVQKNTPLLLNCSAYSGPEFTPVSYKWTKNGEPLIPSKRVRIAENGSLYFQHIKRKKRINYNDEGKYACFLTNSEGTVIGRQVQLKIARIARSFRKVPVDQEVVVGGVARFECNIDATPSAVYIWSKDEASLPLDDRITKLSSGILQIHNVQLRDAGLYRCSACHSFQGIVNLDQSKASIHWRHSNDATLTVIKGPASRPPKLVSSSKEVTAIVDEAATLECLVDGEPQPTVDWYKEGLNAHGEPTLVPVEEDVYKVRKGYSNLEFKELDSEDHGIYHCVASSAGHPDIDTIIKLNVRQPPMLDDGPDSILVPIAQRVRLQCVVHGIPKPSISWYRNGKLIKSNGHVFINSNGELRIESVPSDSGYYQCVAENPVGHVMSTARLKVTKKENAPEPPQNLEVAVLSSTQISVKWNESRIPENCNCEIVAYTLHYKEVHPEAQDKKEITQMTSALLDDLHPFTTYEFYVIAYGRFGASRDSEKVQATTLEWVPVIAPEISLSSTIPGSIDVSWEPIPESQSNGIITRYKIFCRDEHSMVPFDPIQVPANMTSYRITSLKSSTTYNIRVLAGTAIGYPNMSDSEWPWVKHTTLPRDNSSPSPIPLVSHLYVTTIDNTTVKFDWSVANVSQPVTEYRLFIHKVIGKIDSEIRRFNASTTSYTMTGLEDRTFYEVVLVIHSRETILGIKSEVFQTHHVNVLPMPPPPWDITTQPVTSTMMSVTWHQPKSVQEITYYTVRYSKAHDTDIKTQKTKSPSIVLENLMPFTMYNISIRSHSRHSHGPFGNPVLIRTKEGVPSPPVSIHVKPLSKFEVILTWSPPVEENGRIIHYVIMYSMQKEKPDSSWKTLQQNASTTSVIIKDLSDNVYYFKMMAVTKAGRGPCSPPIQVFLQGCTIDCLKPESNTSESPSGTVVHDQRLGIILGCSVGLASIIICILVVVLRQRHYARLAGQHQVSATHLHHNTSAAHLHQNGHTGMVAAALPDGNSEVEQGACAHYPLLGDHGNMKANGVILTGSGKIIYLCNGANLDGGKLRAVVAEPYNHESNTTEIPEQRCLLSVESQQNNEDLALNMLTRSHDCDSKVGDVEVSCDPSWTHTKSPAPPASQTPPDSARGDNSGMDSSGQYSPCKSSAVLDGSSTSHSFNQGENGVPHYIDGASLNETNICSGSHHDVTLCNTQNGKINNSGKDLSDSSYGENSGDMVEQYHSNDYSTAVGSDSSTPDNLRKGDNSLSSDELLYMMLESTTSKDFVDCTANNTTSLSAAGGQSSRVKDTNPSFKQSGVNNTLPQSSQPRSRSPVTKTTADNTANSVDKNKYR